MFPAALVPGRARADAHDEHSADDKHEQTAHAPRGVGVHLYRMPDLAPGGEWRSALMYARVGAVGRLLLAFATVPVWHLGDKRLGVPRLL